MQHRKLPKHTDDNLMSHNWVANVENRIMSIYATLRNMHIKKALTFS